MGGARRDEEKARAKERFSFLTGTILVNGTLKTTTRVVATCSMEKNIRANTLEYFSISNWTENGCVAIHTL